MMTWQKLSLEKFKILFVSLEIFHLMTGSGDKWVYNMFYSWPPGGGQENGLNWGNSRKISPFYVSD